MKTYIIVLASKNKKSLTEFCQILINNTLQKSLKLFINKELKVFKNTKKITILKSPHVNKSAQEQFESQTFYKKLLISTKNSAKTIKLLKYLKTNKISDIKFKLILLVSQKQQNKKTSFIFKPNNFKLNILNIKKQKLKTSFNLLTKTKIYLKILDLYGETLTTK